MTVGAFFQRHTIKAVTGDSRAVDSFGSHSAVFSNCKARTAERRISFANHGIAAYGQPRAGIRADDGYTVDTCNACQSTVHFNIGNIYQTAEHVCLIGKARFHIIISGFVPETDLIGSIGHTIGTDSDAVSMFLANFCGHP